MGGTIEREDECTNANTDANTNNATKKDADTNANVDTDAGNSSLFFCFSRITFRPKKSEHLNSKMYFFTLL